MNILYITLEVIEGPDKNKVFEIHNILEKYTNNVNKNNENDTIIYDLIKNNQKFYIIGRYAMGSEAHILLSNKDQYISRNHCLLELKSFDEIYLTDNNSLNGTILIRGNKNNNKDKLFENFNEIRSGNNNNGVCNNNKIKIKYREKLFDNDIILIGKTKIRIGIGEIYKRT